MMQTENRWNYPAIGIATVALIDSTVNVTTRQSDSVPIASEVAMALVNRKLATGTGRLPKPAVPDDRIMVYILQNADESPATSREFRRDSRLHCGDRATKAAKSRQRLTLCPLLLTFGSVLARK